jgi:hypothetical protein
MSLCGTGNNDNEKPTAAEAALAANPAAKWHPDRAGWQEGL